MKIISFKNLLINTLRLGLYKTQLRSTLKTIFTCKHDLFTIIKHMHGDTIALTNSLKYEASLGILSMSIYLFVHTKGWHVIHDTVACSATLGQM